MRPVRRKVKELLRAGTRCRAQEDAAHLREHPEGGALLVDVRAGRRGRADEQRGGACACGARCCGGARAFGTQSARAVGSSGGS